MKNYYRATAFIRFSIEEGRMKEVGLDIEMPPSGVLHDDLVEFLDGNEGVAKVESVVIKECAPLPAPVGELEIVQTICEGCQQLKETEQTQNGRLCTNCAGSVYPFKKRKEIK